MKKIKGYILVAVILGMFLLGFNAVADSTYTIDVDPSEPEPLSTVTFIATVTGDSVEEVYLIVIECKDDSCYTIDAFNESMESQGGDVYQKAITLMQSDANNIEYYLVVKDNGIWYNFLDQFEVLNLKISSGNGGNGGSTNGDDGSTKTPGFELLVFIISIVILVFILKRKRDT